MRTFTLALALTLPLALAACNAEPEESEAVEDYQEDVQGPIQEEVGQELTGYDSYDLDNDGLLSNDEYDAGIGDDDFGTYDTNADGFLDDDEYGVYEDGLTM